MTVTHMILLPQHCVLERFDVAVVVKRQCYCTSFRTGRYVNMLNDLMEVKN